MAQRPSSKGNGGAWIIAALVGVGVAYVISEDRKRRAAAGIPTHIDGLAGFGTSVKRFGRKIAKKVRTSKATPIVLTAAGIAAGAAITVITAGAGAPAGAAIAAAGSAAGTALKNHQDDVAADNAAKRDERATMTQLAEQQHQEQAEAQANRGVIGDLDDVVRGWGLGDMDDEGEAFDGT